MRTLKYALLGQIVMGEKSGYDLMQIFGEDMSHAWYASHSQIYPELRKMVAEGLIGYETEIQGKVLEKKVYAATEKGRKEFEKWMNQTTTITSSPKDEFRLKLMYLSCVSPESFLPRIQEQIAYRSKRMEKQVAVMAKYKEPPEDLEELGNYLALKGSLLKEESYIAWLRFCEDTLSERCKK